MSSDYRLLLTKTIVSMYAFSIFIMHMYISSESRYFIFFLLLCYFKESHTCFDCIAFPWRSLVFCFMGRVQCCCAVSPQIYETMQGGLSYDHNPGKVPLLKQNEKRCVWIGDRNECMHCFYIRDCANVQQIIVREFLYDSQSRKCFVSRNML